MDATRTREEGLLKVGEVARLTGLFVKTLPHYEDLEAVWSSGWKE